MEFHFDLLSDTTMPTIQYEGRTYVLKTIRLKCLKCNTFCETSKPYPNMEHCDCGLVVVDGGISAGATVNGNSLQMEDYSIYRTEDSPKVQLPQEVVTQHHNRVRQAAIDTYKKYGIPLDEIMSGR